MASGSRHSCSGQKLSARAVRPVGPAHAPLPLDADLTGCVRSVAAGCYVLVAEFDGDGRAGEVGLAMVDLHHREFGDRQGQLGEGSARQGGNATTGVTHIDPVADLQAVHAEPGMQPAHTEQESAAIADHLGCVIYSTLIGLPAMTFPELGSHPRGVPTRPRHPGPQVVHGDHDRFVEVLLVTRLRPLAHQPTGLDPPHGHEPGAGWSGLGRHLLDHPMPR